MAAQGARVVEAGAIARIIARIEADRPAAIAGPIEFWARITGLPLATAAAALDALADRGVVRRQPLGDQSGAALTRHLAFMVPVRVQHKQFAAGSLLRQSCPGTETGMRRCIPGP